MCNILIAIYGYMYLQHFMVSLRSLVPFSSGHAHVSLNEMCTLKATTK